MEKYSEEKRLAAVLEVEAGKSTTQVAKQYRISEDTLKMNVRQYREHGEDGFHTSAYNLSAKQKYEILKYKRENQLSNRETGIKFRTSQSIIRHWEKRYKEKGMMGLEDKRKGKKPKKPKPEPPKTREELLEENKYLRAENEYLKKLNALVTEREERERGTE